MPITKPENPAKISPSFLSFPLIISSNVLIFFKKDKNDQNKQIEKNDVTKIKDSKERVFDR